MCYVAQVLYVCNHVVCVIMQWEWVCYLVVCMYVCYCVACMLLCMCVIVWRVCYCVYLCVIELCVCVCRYERIQIAYEGLTQGIGEEVEVQQLIQVGVVIDSGGCGN